jgi:hypothetical protein
VFDFCQIHSVNFSEINVYMNFCFILLQFLGGALGSLIFSFRRTESSQKLSFKRKCTLWDTKLVGECRMELGKLHPMALIGRSCKVAALFLLRILNAPLSRVMRSVERYSRASPGHSTFSFLKTLLLSRSSLVL